MKASDVTGAFVGESTQKLKRKLDDALGGVLFIDEAYGLTKNSYGRQVLDDVSVALAICLQHCLRFSCRLLCCLSLFEY